MTKTPFKLKNDESVVGFIETEKEIKHSIINSFKLHQIEFTTHPAEPPESVVDFLFAAKFSIDNVPRIQRIWNFDSYKFINTTLVVKNPILRPDGMCVACAGSGKYRAKTFKSTSKCPSCKGSGFITNVWNSDEGENSGNRTDMVERSQDDTGTS